MTANHQMAETIRMHGNDAFATKDWKRAIQLYQKSIQIVETAKCYSNLAATYCKIMEFNKATKAAERATILDPTWSKGWYRRGVVAEQNKDFKSAYKYFCIAVDLDRTETSYQQAAFKLQKQLKIKQQQQQQQLSNNSKQSTFVAESNYNKFVISQAWKAFIKDNSKASMNVYVPMQPNYHQGGRSSSSSGSSILPTSEQWLVHGLNEWTIGLKDAVARMVIFFVPEINAKYQKLMQQQLPADKLKQSLIDLVGGNPNTIALQSIANGISHLGGQYLQYTEPPFDNDDNVCFCPQPPHLHFMKTYQQVATLFAIHGLVQELYNAIPYDDIPMSKAVLYASEMACTNLALPKPKYVNDSKLYATPQQAVDFVKKLVANNNDNNNGWNGTMGIVARKYISLQYRGSIVFGTLLRTMFDKVHECFEFETWAFGFMELASETFKSVPIDQKGTTFLPSFRIGMMVSQLQSMTMVRHKTLQQRITKVAITASPYSIEQSLDLCMSIIQRANTMELPKSNQNKGDDDKDDNNNNKSSTTPSNAFDSSMDYFDVQNKVAFYQKPLAKAHGMIGQHLSDLLLLLLNTDKNNNVLSQQALNEILIKRGIKSNNTNDKRDGFALAAEHYRLAAEYELYDAIDCAKYYWGYACHLVLSGPVRGDLGIFSTSYTLGDLRNAIAQAEQAEQSKNINLFGKNQQQQVNGNNDNVLFYEAIARVTALHYHQRPDSFILPSTIHIVTIGTIQSLEVQLEENEMEVICHNVKEFQELMQRKGNDNDNNDDETNNNNNNSDELLSLSNDNNSKIPSLVNLCIRQLHRQGCEYSKGETDGSIIAYKVLVSAQRKEEEITFEYF